MAKGNSDLKEALSFANKFFKNKNFDKAEKLYKKILKKFPNNFDANYFMASIKAQNNKFSDAKDYMETALSINPNLPELNNNLGLVYLFVNKSLPKSLSREKGILESSNNQEGKMGA